MLLFQEGEKQIIDPVTKFFNRLMYPGAALVLNKGF